MNGGGKIRIAVWIGWIAVFTACEPAAVDRGPWSDAQFAVMRSLSLRALGPPVASPGNRVASKPGAAAFGHRLFFDPALSRNREISCASCHFPELYFTDGQAVSTGLSVGNRNSPTLVGVARSPWQFWDGRRDSLWSQALAPLEARGEMGSTRLEVVRLITTREPDRTEYIALFGEPPDLSDPNRFPERASPFGDSPTRAAWAHLLRADSVALNIAFANIGKVIGAYQRLLEPGASRFDRYVEALESGQGPTAGELFNADETAGLALFLDMERTRCLQCHNGPLLTNQAFHKLGSGKRRSPDALPDLGRLIGAQALLLDPFNCLGAYSDAKAGECQELEYLNRKEIGEMGSAFKTPTLRNVAETAPYFHDGSFATLAEVMEHYRNPPPRETAVHELVPLELDDREVAQLVDFLRTLTGPIAADAKWLRPPE